MCVGGDYRFIIVLCAYKMVKFDLVNVQKCLLTKPSVVGCDLKPCKFGLHCVVQTSNQNISTNLQIHVYTSPFSHAGKLSLEIFENIII